MTTLNNPRTIAIATTVLCVASLFWLLSTQRVNSSLQSTLEQEKLRSEALLSEKLLLEKDIEKAKSQLSSLRGINEELDQVVRTTEAKFAARELELKKLKKQNASLEDLRKQRQALLKIQSDLERELASVRSAFSGLESENQILSQKLAQLQEQNGILMNDLNRAVLASMDRTQVQTVKGRKERLTVRARKTDKLIASFDVPGSFRNISFRVLDGNGKLMTDKEGTIVSHTVPSANNAVASAENYSVESVQKVHMEYLPKVKLRSGVYTVEILNDNLYVGSVNVKLR